jgi:hypothetical protein
MNWAFLELYKDAAIWLRPAKNGTGNLFTFTASPARKPSRRACVVHNLDDVRLAVRGELELLPPDDVTEDPWAEYRVAYHRKLRIDTGMKSVRYYDKNMGAIRSGVILSRTRTRSRERLTLLLGEPIDGQEKPRTKKAAVEKVAAKKGEAR